jgi:hypothetical protein
MRQIPQVKPRLFRRLTQTQSSLRFVSGRISHQQALTLAGASGLIPFLPGEGVAWFRQGRFCNQSLISPVDSKKLPPK